MRTSNVSVVMPAYNEADGIAEFLAELELSLAGHDVRFVVVDDCSSDGTLEVLEGAAADGIPVHAVRNESNRGHGPSTLHALQQGLERGSRVVVAVDGDGQFDGSDVAMAVKLLLEAGYDVVEGVRVARDEPWFRRLTASATRMLVRLRCGRKPRDANTPLRVYNADALARLLNAVPADAVTPNLVISALSRRWGLRILEHPVAHRRHRGSTVAGTTWQARRRNVPSVRFLSFCLAATRQWFSIGGSDTKRMPDVRATRRWSVLLLLPALLIAGYYAVLAYVEPVGVDSGVFMYCGRQVLNGLAPYTDCWDHKGPLVYLLNALGLALGGPRGVRVLEGVLLTASLAFATRCWARLVPPRAAVLVGALYAFSVVNLIEDGDMTETWLSAFSLVAFALFLASVRRRAAPHEVFRAALALGVAIGVAATTRPNNGLGLVVAAFALVLASRGRSVRLGLTVAAGAAAVVVPVLAFVASRGALGTMWAQYIVYNRTYGPTSALVSRHSLIILTEVLLALPLTTVVLLLRTRHSLRGIAGAGRIATTALAVAVVVDLLSQGKSGFIFMHYLVTVLPALATYGVAVVFYGRRRPMGEAAIPRRALGIALIVLATATMALWSVRLSSLVAEAWAEGLTNPHSSVSVLVRRIDAVARPGDPVLVYGARTGLLVAAERSSPTRLTYLFPWVETGPQMRVYVRQVTTHPPRVIVHVPGEPAITRLRCKAEPCDPGARSLDRLGKWIAKRYEHTLTVDGYTVWELKRV